MKIEVDSYVLKLIHAPTKSIWIGDYYAINDFISCIIMSQSLTAICYREQFMPIAKFEVIFNCRTCNSFLAIVQWSKALVLNILRGRLTEGPDNKK